MLRSRLLPAAVRLAVVAASLTTLAAAQVAIAPPRGDLGPGPGDSASGGPGNRGDNLLTSLASWTQWWTFNREPYLARRRAPQALPARPAPLGGKPLPENAARPDARIVHMEVVPLLRERLASTRDLDLLASCLIALGKIGEPPAELAEEKGLPPTAEAILPHLEASNQAIRGFALLALGLLGDARHVPLFVSVALDEGDERKALRTRSLDRRTRAFAAYALGYVGMTTTRRSERSVVVHHLQRLADAERKDVDLLTAAVVALGWNPVPFEPRPLDDGAAEASARQGRERTIELLWELFEDRRAEPRGQAQVPVAIARLLVFDSPAADADAAVDIASLREALRGQAVERLTRALAGPKPTKDLRIREGCVQALGLLVDVAQEGPDKAATAALLAVARKGQEGEAGLALVALGRLVGRLAGAEVPAAEDLRTDIRSLAVNGPAMRRPWALLALGVAADRAAAAGADPALGTEVVIANRLVGAPTPEERAAAAIALGLANAVDAAEEISEGLDSGDFWARGLRAIALALMDARAAVPALRQIVAEPAYRPYLLRDVATSLALFGDRALVDQLVFRLAVARFMPERVAALLALAWSDDPNATGALLFVLREDRMSRRRIDDTSRAFAATALGTICGRPALPWNTNFALDVTWRAAPPTLTDPRSGGGVLDVL